VADEPAALPDLLAGDEDEAGATGLEEPAPQAIAVE
jgi:hypothetical protein